MRRGWTPACIQSYDPPFHDDAPVSCILTLSRVVKMTSYPPPSSPPQPEAGPSRPRLSPAPSPSRHPLRRAEAVPGCALCALIASVPLSSNGRTREVSSEGLQREVLYRDEVVLVYRASPAEAMTKDHLVVVPVKHVVRVKDLVRLSATADAKQ